MYTQVHVFGDTLYNCGCGKKYPPNIFCSFVSNRLKFQSEMLPTYLVILCALNGIIVNQLAYHIFKLSELQ